MPDNNEQEQDVLEVVFDPIQSTESKPNAIYNSGDNRPSTYQESDITVYRASSLGSCIRSLVLSRRGFDPAPYPEDIYKAFWIWVISGKEALVKYIRMQTGPKLLGMVGIWSATRVSDCDW